jgi:putative glycerol-1-phosphate prenyltransferase
MKAPIYLSIQERKQIGKKSFAVLVDPDTATAAQLNTIIETAIDAGVDYFFVGGSLIISNNLENCVQQVKQRCTIPVLLFPGSAAQITPKADALLYLSLISGRNAELLIGQHVVSAPFVRASGLEIISTGYMVIDGGAPTTVSYISNAAPIPADKADIALCTALAGEMLGHKIIYMDAGSGAKRAISEHMIAIVAQHLHVPLVVGGGIRDAEKAYRNCKAGADMIVVGNAIEKDAALIREISDAVHSVSRPTVM